MKIRRNVVLLALVLLPASAFAYVDPGSGMLMWQGLLATLGAVIVCVRSPLDTLRRVLRRFRRK